MWSEDGCYIIGEAGSNHDGDLNVALQLVHAAGEAGCDAVKFQLIPPFGRDWIPKLQTQADWCKIDFLATPFDVESVGILDRFNVPAIKIASPEIVNLGLVQVAGATGRPVILSTGMATTEDIAVALELVDQWGQVDEGHVALLQCTTRYPTPPEQINLRAMNWMAALFKVPAGLSDHSLGTAIPIAAAALGASVIEKHFTLDSSLPGPDHHYALEPSALRAMVEGIRQVEAAMGTGEKGPQEGELVESRGRSLTWT